MSIFVLLSPRQLLCNGWEKYNPLGFTNADLSYSGCLDLSDSKAFPNLRTTGFFFSCIFTRSISMANRGICIVNANHIGFSL